MPKPHSPTRRPNRASASLEIVYEDRDVIVVDKPAGLLTIATEKERHLTVYAILFDHVQSRRSAWRIFVVHRLDREASGLLVFAKTEQAKLHLQEQFKAHTARRTYVAVTEGSMSKDQDTITSYLAENAAFKCYSTRDTTKGKRAVTHVTVLKRSATRTMVEVKLETGRKHQIRVHLSEQGHPIIGDPTYGKTKSLIKRMALHATTLVFRHPHSNKEMTFTSPMPPAFNNALSSP